MNTYKKFLAFALALCSFSHVAKAGSYQLNDYSVTGLGRAYAGAGVVGDDYSAIAFNPAGMSLKKTGAQIGATEVYLHADLNSIPAGQYGKMSHWVSVPNFFSQYQVNDKLHVGFGVYAPYGLATRYRDGWFGSDSAMESTLTILDLSPAVSYKLTDQFTIGASVIARYIYGKMTNTLNAIGGGKSVFELDGWTTSGTLGILYEPIKDTRFGLSYRLRSNQQVKGDHEVSGTLIPLFNETATGWASPDLPETFTLSFYQKIQKFGLSATARWTHWSQSFPEFSMKSDSHLLNAANGSPLSSEVLEKKSIYNYDNAWSLSLGTDYYYNDNFTFRFGIAFDEGATHNNNTRTYRIPDNDRFWTSIGASYKTEHYQFDIGYSHLFVRTSEIIADPNFNKETRSGKVITHSDIIGLQAQYNF